MTLYTTVSFLLYSQPIRYERPVENHRIVATACQRCLIMENIHQIWTPRMGSRYLALQLYGIVTCGGKTNVVGTAHFNPRIQCRVALLVFKSFRESVWSKVVLLNWTCFPPFRISSHFSL